VFGVNNLLSLLDAVAMAAAGASGALMAARKRMDVVGFILIAAVTGLGGGTLRDLMLGRLPLVWLERPDIFIVITLLAVLVFVLTPRVPLREDTLLWADAVGMAAYTVVGAEIALALGTPPWAAILMGVVTATFGGILRDVICNEVPLILSKEIYALAALAGATLFVLLREVGVWRDTAIVAGMAMAFAVRGAAILRGWSFPPYRGPH
jgi:uncharacterized membrane protein YeiH